MKMDRLEPLVLAIVSNMFFSKSDAKLLKEIAMGDQKSFEALYTKYKSDVFGVSLRLVKTRSIAEEISQRVWMKVIDKADSFKGDESAKSWLLTIVKNQCLNEIKASKKWKSFDDVEDLNHAMEASLAAMIPDNQFWSDLEVEKAKECLNQLNERQRVSLVLFYLEEKPISELAKDLDLQTNAIKALLFRARKNMINCVQGVRLE
jgi:RNA polymerase sigma-70 factor (ECF subfamily)